MSRIWERADVWPVDGAGPMHADDYTRGFADGRRVVEAEVEGERAALLQLASAIETLEPPLPGLLASLMMAAVERLVIDIAGTAPVDGALLGERAAALSARIADEADAVLVVHPDDAVLLGDMAVIADPAVARGTVQARIGTTLIEDGVQSALARLRAEISDMGIAL